VKTDETLTGSIKKLDAKLAELGQRMTAVEAQIAALQSYKADIDANKEGVAANKEAIDKLVTDLVALEAGELTDEMIQAIAIRVEDIVGGVRSQLEVITVALKKQVTHVSLYKRANAMVEEKELTLDLVSAEAVRTWTFGEGLEGAISFTKGNKETFEDSFVIRVSPTTATLDKYMIRLVNSQMEDLSNLLEIKSIEPYTDLLVATRTISQNGLWKVTVKLKDNYDTDAYHDAAAIYEEDENGDEKVKADILYAVMVSGEEHDGREVVSEYGLTLAQLNKGTKHELFFNVDKTPVEEIHNRWLGTGSSKSEDETSVSYEELAWDMTLDGGNYKYAPWAEPITTGNGKNVVPDGNDMRQELPAYSVIAGKPFTVNFDEAMADTIRGFYVTLDEACAVESQPSEINAWRSYHVKGLNTVTSDSSLELTIPEDVNADGDYIGFRVYAVNYDGSLVDPDGKAFYVYVGVPAENWNAVNTVIIPDANSSNNVTDEKSASQAVTLTKLTGAVKATWVTDKIGTNEHVFDAVFEGISFTTTSLSTTASSISSVDFSKVVKIHTVPTINDWTKYVDNKAYNGTLTIYDVHGSVLATINITMTKQLPTAPEGFSVKTNQLDASGIYNCYLIPDNWAAQQATNGTMDMDYVFNWGAGVPAQYVISFAKAEKDGGKDVANDVNGGDILTVAKDYIDNKTQHATVVSYNFGKISSETKDEDGNFADYKVEVKTFPTVFNCIYNDTYTWSWDNKAANAIATNTKLVYGTNYTFKNNSGSEYSFIQAIKGTSSKDGKYSRLLSDPYEESLTLKPGEEAHLISKANGAVDEYFKVDTSGDTFKFIASTVSDDTNPTAAVPSTLKLVYVDMYGHDVVIELDMTVVPR
ncbi:cell surface protein, partial [uncultured Bacteroides sp.]|uniref:cell surface protein n=1 Tax=uncultured Bacteroides sp. TaxID=162156 RepID=UPI002629A4D3